MQCKSMQCMSTSVRNGKAAVVLHVQTKAKVARAAKASSRREARARRSVRNRSASLNVNAGTARRKGHKKAECRKMKADLDAGKCDKHGKPTCVKSLTATGATQPSPASELCAEPGEHHPAAADGPSALPESRWQSALRNLVHQHDRAGPVDSHGCKLGRSRIRVVGFWIWP